MPFLATFKDLKDSGISRRINLCPDDPRFLQAANRVMRWLLMHGGWSGTVRMAEFCVDQACITMPGCVASLEGVYNGCRAVPIFNHWYQFLPYKTPPTHCCSSLVFEAFDTIPTQTTLCEPAVLRVFPGHPNDIGKTITFYGSDVNKIWVRSDQAGEYLDGEKVTIASPFVDTVTIWSSISGVQKDLTNEQVRVFSHPFGSSELTPLATYEYYETRPNYQRYRIPQYGQISRQDCSTNCGTKVGYNVVTAMVKLDFIEIRKDNDFLTISNFPALELAFEALKAKDEGDLAKCDVLLYGNGRNERLGAIPMLNQELQTNTSGRFWGRVNLFGTAPLRRKFAGFI